MTNLLYNKHQTIRYDKLYLCAPKS